MVGRGAGYLDRFAAFLHEHYPSLARTVAEKIVAKTNLLTTQPHLGRTLAGHEHYRQIVLRILNAPYVIQYRIDENRVVVLRVFHGREQPR